MKKLWSKLKVFYSENERLIETILLVYVTSVALFAVWVLYKFFSFFT